ncbi:MAG: amidohydrolase family protein [Candidatus Melainabacteria bacterium]|nr:amidohydrolase family protein [Candidatus Melainabacteria bacterium]
MQIDPSDCRILFARWVLPISGPPMKDAAVLIEDRTIIDVLFKEELSYKYPPDFLAGLAEEPHDYGDAILLPGLINLHTHLDYSALRCSDVESGMFDWICGLVSTSSKWGPEQWRSSAAFGAREAALAGTSCIVDSSFSGFSVHALAETGLRAIVGLELFGLRDDEANAAWGHWLTKFDALKNTSESASNLAMATEKIKLTVAPHAPYTVCPTLWLKATTWAQEKGLPLMAHLSESDEECQWIKSDNRRIDEYLTFVKKLFNPNLPTTDSGILEELAQIRWKGRGASPTKHLKNYGLLDENLIAAHAVHLDEEDLHMLVDTNVKIAHCPRSNAKLRNGRASLEKFIEAGLKFGLGTDGLASNDDLNLINEARFAGDLHRAHVPGMQWNSEQIVKSMTLDAARILNLNQEIGSIEAGKLADIAVFKLEHRTHGSDNPYDLLIHGKTRLLDLFVDGRAIVANGELT